MDLKNFVTQTLLQIQEGVHAAIEASSERGVAGVINPVWGSAEQANASNLREISFDVAVTVSGKAADALGGGLRVAGIGFGAESTESSERSHVSRIQFSIPVIPPVTELKRPGYSG